MSIRQRRCWVNLGGGAVAAVLLLSSCSSGSGHGSTGAAAPTTVAPDESDPNAVHLTDYSNDDGARSAVILTGAVGDYGQAVSVKANGATDAGHGDQLELNLTHGSFRLSIADLDKKIVSAFTNFPANTTTCSGLVSLDGAAPIVPGYGTGSYRHIHGSFRLHVSIDEVDQKTHCGPSSKFLSQAVVITGWAQLAR